MHSPRWSSFMLPFAAVMLACTPTSPGERA
jgi:hypothetical protein